MGIDASIICEYSSDGVITLENARKISSRYGVGLKEVEARALELGIWPCRLSRHASLTGTEQQLSLLRSVVAIAGCGGLGGHVAMLLARLGLGRLVLLDPDRVQESNINRQVCADIETVGSLKVEVLHGLIARVNPAATVEIRACRVQECENVFGEADAVADCLDAPAPRKWLRSLCAHRGIVLVRGAVGGWCGEVAVENWHESQACRHRALLPGGSSLMENVANEPVDAVFPFTPAVVAAIQVSELFRALTGHRFSGAGKWLFTDLETAEFAGPFRV